MASIVVVQQMLTNNKTMECATGAMDMIGLGMGKQVNYEYEYVNKRSVRLSMHQYVSVSMTQTINKSCACNSSLCKGIYTENVYLLSVRLLRYSLKCMHACIPVLK